MAAGSEKRAPWWNQGIKEAIRAKKDFQAIKMSNERSWEKFGCRLDSSYSSANKVFWQTIRRLHGKSLSTTTTIKDLTGNIPGMRRKFFHVGENTLKICRTQLGKHPLTNVIQLILGKRKSSH